LLVSSTTAPSRHTRYFGRSVRRSDPGASRTASKHPGLVLDAWRGAFPISKSSAECLRSLAPPTWPLPTEHTTMAMESGDNGSMADGQVCTLCGDTFAEVSRYKAFPMCNTCYDAAHQADMTVARCVAAVAARMVSTCDWSCPHALSFDWLSPSSL
jgi:hypothetical protein